MDVAGYSNGVFNDTFGLYITDVDVAGNTITFNREVEEVISNTYLYPRLFAISAAIALLVLYEQRIIFILLL